MPRADNRAAAALRPVRFQPHFLRHAYGSVLVEIGRTRVVCAASLVKGVPKWMFEQGLPGGWVTAEYAMLPAATPDRKAREITLGRQDGRTQEIQRLIGRSLRATVDMTKLPQATIYVDCDVLDADGGTRCASICGGAVALQLALRRLFLEGLIKSFPVTDTVAAVSVGKFGNDLLLDLDYREDVAAAVDMNVVMTGSGGLVELQGTGEHATFTPAETAALLTLATKGIQELIALQKQALAAGAAGK